MAYKGARFKGGKNPGQVLQEEVLKKIEALKKADIVFQVPGVVWAPIMYQFNGGFNFEPWLAQINARHAKGIRALEQRLELELNMQMQKSWTWIDGSRDIIDTGTLQRSVTINMDTGMNGSIDVTYDTPYANLVHYGGYINPYGNPNIKIYLPARPWVETAFSNVNTEWERIYMSAANY